MPLLSFCAILLALIVHSVWAEPESWRRYLDGGDLARYVTRPDIQAPRYMVAKHNPDAIKPGYILISPWTDFFYSPATREKKYAPCIAGPMIYDGDGELVWSGACEYGNKPTFDLRAVHINDSDYLTFIVNHRPTGEKGGMQAFLMNNQYQQIAVYNATDRQQDPHEFNILPGGRKALISTRQVTAVDLPILGPRTVIANGFQEIDLATNKVFFDWKPLKHGVLAHESCDTYGMNHPHQVPEWDFFHLNSVDKFLNGDYLVSSRRMSTVYKLSGRNGKILWRLGGCYDNISGFTMDVGVPFFWQHDARVRFENATHTIISLHDNAGEAQDGSNAREPNTLYHAAVAKIILLDMTRMHASILRHFPRPDGGQTPTMGSVATLPSHPEEDIRESSILVNWAWEGYISEYDSRDNLVMEARFLSDRLKTFKAFKYEWTGFPLEAPVLKILPLAVADGGVGTAFYVSWNGATEVRSWKVYTASGDSDSFSFFTEVGKRGFETSWVHPTSLFKRAYAEGLDEQGKVLGTTAVAVLEEKFEGGYEVIQPVLQGVRVSARGWGGIIYQTIVSALALVGACWIAVVVLTRANAWRKRGYAYHAVPLSNGQAY